MVEAGRWRLVDKTATAVTSTGDDRALSDRGRQDGERDIGHAEGTVSTSPVASTIVFNCKHRTFCSCLLLMTNTNNDNWLEQRMWVPLMR